ncbi:MAG: DedA family protein [Dissulfurispiraceae bacterium]|nr:DedA family protein [Dissulfurispiraceae bacterium]
MAAQFIDIILHLDKHLAAVIQAYGSWTYLIFFLIIFCETGLVVTPFLPGDSLLFAAGTFAALGELDPLGLAAVLCSASILGDSTNYWIGRYVGPKVFRQENVRFLNKKHLERTEQFYERYGAKTIFIARFMPIFRTFAPFVAGIGRMKYARFLVFSISGSITWISVLVMAGFYFGNIPFVRQNFTLVIMAIIIISVMPGVLEFVRHKLNSRQN